MSLKRIAGILGALLIVVTLVVAYFVSVRVPITSYPAPPRSDVAATVPDEKSVLVATVGIPLADIRRQLENDVPRRLWSINRKLDDCVPRSQVRVLGTDIIQTPKIGCTIVGSVTRGAITLTGSGATLTARFPITVAISAEDVGGVIKRETATGSAIIELQTNLSVDNDWRAQARVDLSYEWANEPGIDFLGQRIRFTDQADSELRPVVSIIERSLERQIGNIDLRSKVENLWQQAFTVESLNAENPPVWLRLDPEQVGIGRVRVAQGRILIDTMIVADTQIAVGAKPDDPDPKPLGQNVAVDALAGINATIPVFADYAELEPVILRALRRLAASGLDVKGIGQLEVSFESVELYATVQGRIAVGITATADLAGSRAGGLWSKTSGKIWLTGKPVTQAGSAVLKIENLKLFGDMDTATGDLLVWLASNADVIAEIENALVEDFRNDYDDVIAKARAGASSVRLRGLDLNFEIVSVEHGPIEATADGLYMPVRASGSVNVNID